MLYHFASKRALIDGLSTRWLDDFEAQLSRRRPAAAYVRACDLSGRAGGRASEFGLLAAMIEEPEVLEVARERYAAVDGRVCSGGALDPASTRGWCAWRPTVCGIPICSASPLRRATIAAA